MSNINFLLLCERVFTEIQTESDPSQLLQEAISQILQICKDAASIRRQYTQYRQAEPDREKKRALEAKLAIELNKFRARAVEYARHANYELKMRGQTQLITPEEMKTNPDDWFDVYFAKRYFKDYPDILTICYPVVPHEIPKDPDRKLLPTDLMDFQKFSTASHY